MDVRIQNILIGEFLETYNKLISNQIPAAEELFKNKLKIGSKENLIKFSEGFNNIGLLIKAYVQDIIEEKEQEENADASIPKHDKEYRYKVSDLVNIYDEFVGGTLHRNTFNQYTLPNKKDGTIILPAISLKGERKSVLESELLTLFAEKFHVILDPKEIRKHSYKPPKFKVL